MSFHFIRLWEFVAGKWTKKDVLDLHLFKKSVVPETVCEMMRVTIGIKMGKDRKM